MLAAAVLVERAGIAWCLGGSAQGQLDRAASDRIGVLEFAGNWSLHVETIPLLTGASNGPDLPSQR